MDASSSLSPQRITRNNDSPEREDKYRRAQALLADAGWLFDDFVNNEMRRVLTSDADDMTSREVAYTRARVATELKACLAGYVEEYEANALRNERRDLMKESIHGRRS